MNKFLSFLAVVAIILSISCRKTVEQAPDFSGELTREEIDGGRLTAEILWKFGRTGNATISPGGLMVAYTVTRFDHNMNRSKTDIHVLDLETMETGVVSSYEGANFNVRWNPDGERIGYLSAESGSVQLWEIDPDGGGKRQVSDNEGGLSSYEYSPVGDHIYYTAQVKLDPTPAEIYPESTCHNSADRGTWY
jgi:Tol biopolymer transport system component